jgi:hypothetical protein
MTEPLTEDGVRRLLVAIFRAASDVLSGESGDETPPAPSPAPREPNLTSGDRATLTRRRGGRDASASAEDRHTKAAGEVRFPRFEWAGASWSRHTSSRRI